jgi:formylglycine-generating enzyme required for sulfatase activity
MIQIPAGRAALGLSRASGEFGWDNEFEEHAAEVPEFSIDRFKVTNGEFLEFLNAGGYQNRALWNDADWGWVRSQTISHPAFWKREGDGWRFRGMFEESPLPLDAPVYVSHAEAEAYARWKGKALPTEEQWQRAAYGMPDGLERQFPWGADVPSRARGNFDFARWDPTPTTAFQAGNSAWGVSDLLGNGWEWTSTFRFIPDIPQISSMENISF